jgi:hypothetical protein
MERVRLIIEGQVFELYSLNPDMDKNFLNFYLAIIKGTSFNFISFEASVYDFLDKNPEPSDNHNKYFDNFTIIWEKYLKAGNFVDAEQVWEMALSPVHKWEKNHPHNRIHKGTAYYFWGKTALEHGDLDKGYALMHQAVEEDILTHSGSISPNTPAISFAILDYEKTDQNYREWVLKQAEFIDQQLRIYDSRFSRNFSIEDFRHKFLQDPSNQEIVFIFTFALARLMRLYSFPPDITKSRFVAQLQANILFDLILVIDSLIKLKNVGKWKFIDHIIFLSNATNQSLTNSDLKNINSQFDADFGQSLEDAISGNLVLQNSKGLTHLESDLALVYELRNYGAHNILSIPAIWAKYRELFQCVMEILFLVVDYLY